MLLNSSLLNTVVLNDYGATSSSPGGTGTGGSARFVSTTDIERMLDGAIYAVFVRVRVADPAGVLRDYSNRNNIDWTTLVEIQATVDEPIATATVKFLREQGSKSLSPFRTDSSYNQIPYVADDLTEGTGPSLDVGRRILIDIAAVDAGTDPDDIVDADWHLVFEGTVDSVDAASTQLVIEARDKSAAIQDAWFPAPFVYTPDLFPGTTFNVQTALTNLLLDGHLDTYTPLFVPVVPAPEVLVGSFRVDIEPVMDAVLRISQINGWELRQRFSDLTQQFELTYRDPGRNRTDCDYVLDTHSYIDITKWRIDRASIRNDITINYGPEETRATYRETSAESVRRYGRRSMVITEASDSPIQTEDDARLMAQLILYDLAAPPLEVDAEMLVFWPIEINNIIRFPENLVHSDTVTDVAVAGYRHTIEADGRGRTQLQLRGKPGLGYWNWFLRKPVIGGGLVPDGDADGSNFDSLSQAPDYAADEITFGWVWYGDPSATFDVVVQRGTSGFEIAAASLTDSFYTYDVGVDIEPFHTPPGVPQLPIYVSFYVKATVGGEYVATSPTSNASYGFGP